MESEQRRQQAFWDSSEEKERQRTSRRKRKKRREKEDSSHPSSSFSSCSRCSVLEIWTHSCPLSLAFASLPEEYRNVRLFLGGGFMVTRLVSGSHLFACLARVLGSTVDTVLCQSTEAFWERRLLEKCRCVQRLAWSDSGYTPMRQSTRHLEGFSGGTSTALCIWQSLVRHCPCLRSTVTPFFWETTSGYAVFNSLLGSTVDTFLCQFTESCGNSRTSLREGGPRILRSIPSCAGGFLTDYTFSL